MIASTPWIAVSLGFTALRVIVHSRTDERERPILSWAGVTQSTMVFLTLAALLVVLPAMYHGEGAVPVVYCCLIFGSAFIAHMVSYFLGILLGCWGARYYGQG